MLQTVKLVMKMVNAFNVNPELLAPSHAVKMETQEQLLITSKASVFLNAQLLTRSSSQTHLEATASTAQIQNALNVFPPQQLTQLLFV